MSQETLTATVALEEMAAKHKDYLSMSSHDDACIVYGHSQLPYSACERISFIIAKIFCEWKFGNKISSDPGDLYHPYQSIK